MGCGANKKIIQETRTINVLVHSKDGQIQEFRYDTEYDKLPVTAVMNFLLFDHLQGSVFNANFISRYSPEKKRHQYFIEKLIGISMESEENPYSGKMWVGFINEQRLDWDEICEKDFVIKPSDVVNFKFEKLR